MSPSVLRAVVILVMPVVLVAQAPRALPAPNARLVEEFAHVSAVRELNDGRVLIADNLEGRLVVADLRAGSVVRIGRVGNGPGEYSAVDELYWLPGDSTLMPSDERHSRWLLLVGSQIVATLAPDDARLAFAGRRLVGADASGRLLALRSLPGIELAGGRSQAADAVVLISRDRTRIDTIARLRGAETRMVVAGSAERPRRMLYQVVYSVADQAVLFPDGWIAVAYQQPYRVDWIAPDRSALRGPELPWQYPRVTETEKAAYGKHLVRRVGPRAKLPPEMPWAETVPPFRESALLAAPDGSLVVLREQWSGSPATEYEVVNRRGQRSFTLALHWNERIVGFGSRSAYVAVADDDGIERLERHLWKP